MQLTRNQKIVGVSLAGVVGWLFYRKKVKLQSHRAETPTGPVQVVVPVATSAGTGAIANVLGNILPTAHADLVGKALGQIPMVIQNGRLAPTRISTIADMQHALSFLKICGTVPLKDSGVLDPPTVACIKAFQTLMSLPLTGLDDSTTKMALESAITKSAISTTAPAILAHPSVVSPPTVNPTIATERDLQRGLNVLGASPKLKEDGKIDPVTIAAIKAFQVVHGLLADGLASPQTKAAIATAMQGPPATAVASTPLASGDFGYVAPPPPPVAHPSIPGFMGAGMAQGIGQPYTQGFREFPPSPGRLGIGQPPPPNMGDPAYMRSWERWQQVHPGSSRHDYDNWCTQYGMLPGAAINGDFGFAHPHGGGFRSGARGRAFALGVPVEVDEDVVMLDDDGNPVSFNGETVRDLEERAVHNAHHAANDAIMRGDRRFEHADIGPGAPPLAGEHRRDEGRVQGHGGARFGFLDRFRGWFGLHHRREDGRPIAAVDANPYIPPAATPPVMNWDPFAVDVVTAPAVDRWHPDDIRRHEELERRDFRPAPPIEPGRPAAPIVDHATPPAPPPPRR